MERFKSAGRVVSTVIHESPQEALRILVIRDVDEVVVNQALERSVVDLKKVKSPVVCTICHCDDESACWKAVFNW
jgi:uncharacterized protein (DUF1786 family)